MKFNDLVLTSANVGATSSRLRKIDLLAELLRRLEPGEIAIGIGFLTGWPRQGKLGVGWSMLESARAPTAASSPELSIADVDAAFTQLQSVRGKQSAAERRRLLTELMARSTAEEQQFLYMLAIGEVSPPVKTDKGFHLFKRVK